MGYLSENENHQVEVLAGAFMLLRQKILKNIGLLDEAFFMYGEDIDLSWRIIQSGYENHYFAQSSIIHYKGESTKKGSLNYVKTFYQAMIIFAKKHFQGQKVSLYILLLQFAIGFRAFLTLFFNLLKSVSLPLLEAIWMGIGLYFIKAFWSNFYFHDPNYYHNSFTFINIPLYVSSWLIGIYISGAYDYRFNLSKLIRGLLIGTILLSSVYGFSILSIEVQE